MLVYTMNHPTINCLNKNLTKRKWKIEIITSTLIQDISEGIGPTLSPSFFLLPMYFEQEEPLISQVINYAERKQIPILFILNRAKNRQWFSPLPTKTIYNTISSPVKDYELSVKVQALLNINIKILSATIKENEFENIKKRIDEDLFLAKTIQNLILPSPLENENISLKSTFQPSSQLSGDLFFWLEIAKNKYGIIIMDVNGHGVHAALISMSMRSLLQGLIEKVQNPEIITNELNKHMNKLFEEFHLTSLYSVPYFTALIAYIDTDEKYISYVNAGHPPGMIYQRKSKKFQLLSKGSLPIGLVPNMPIKGEVIYYEPDSEFILYTDGLIEAPGSSDIMLLNQIQSTFIEGCESKTSDLLFDILLSRMKHSEINDDICIIHGVLT